MKVSFLALFLAALFAPVIARAEVPTWNELDARRAQISADEKALHELYDALPPDARDPEAMVAKVTQVLSTMTAEEKKMVHEAKSLVKGDTSKFPPQVKQAIEILEAYDAPMAAFQKAYDKHNVSQSKYFSDLYARTVEDAYEKRVASGERVTKEMLALLEKTREHYKTYQAGIAEGRMDREKGWLEPGMAQRDSAVAFLGKIGAGLQTPKEIGAANKSWRDGWVNLAKMLSANPIGVITGPWTLLRNKPNIASAAWELDRMVRKFGFSFDFPGRENMPAPGTTPAGTLNIVLMNHTTSHMLGVMDGRTISEFIGANPALVNGGMSKFPLIGKFLAPYEANNRNHIIAGQGDPVNILMDRVKTQGVDSFFAFPEGNTFEGNAYGLRPWQAGFATVILERLRRNQGISLNVIPISSPRHYQFWNSGENPEDAKELVSIVHKPIPPEVVDVMLASGDTQKIARVVRGIWLRSLDTNQLRGDRRLGSPSFASIDALNRATLAKKLGCRAIASLMGL